MQARARTSPRNRRSSRARSARHGLPRLPRTSRAQAQSPCPARARRCCPGRSAAPRGTWCRARGRCGAGVEAGANECVDVAGDDTGPHGLDRPSESVRRGAMPAARSGRRLSHRERRAGVAPVATAAWNEVAQDEVAVGQHATTGWPTHLGGARAGDEICEDGGSLARNPLDRRSDKCPEIELPHPGPSELAGSLLSRIAQLEGRAKQRDLVVVLDGARTCELRSDLDRDRPAARLAANAPHSVATGTSGMTSASARAAPPTGSSGPRPKPG